jgi:hypothetical protein
MKIEEPPLLVSEAPRETPEPDAEDGS